ncbi:hypothetical protein ACVWWK_002608 [Bradyrhizobium sp. LB9.1b]
MNILIGAAMLAVAGILIFIGFPIGPASNRSSCALNQRWFCILQLFCRSLDSALRP